MAWYTEKSMKRCFLYCAIRGVVSMKLKDILSITKMKTEKPQQEFCSRREERTWDGYHRPPTVVPCNCEWDNTWNRWTIRSNHKTTSHTGVVLRCSQTRQLFINPNRTGIADPLKNCKISISLNSGELQNSARRVIFCAYSVFCDWSLFMIWWIPSSFRTIPKRLIIYSICLLEADSLPAIYRITNAASTLSKKNRKEKGGKLLLALAMEQFSFVNHTVCDK